MKTGAKIKHTESGIHITGRNHLKGNILYSYDLRGGASMIIAGLLAHGQTSVYDEDYIKRGYDGLTEKIRALGGDITECHVDP